MSPDIGSYVTDGKQHLSTLKFSFPWETSISQIPRKAHPKSETENRYLEKDQVLQVAFSGM